MTRFGRGLLVLALCFGMVNPLPCFAAREAKEKSGEEANAGELEAKRLFEKGQERLASGQDTDSAIRMLESVIEQYPASRARMGAALALGKHFLGMHEQVKANGYFNQLRSMEERAKTLSPADKEMMLEAMYLSGVSYFQARQYGSAFTILRRITALYPNTVWANQAFYYIGMCHFAQSNWSKAIEALNQVGTFVDPTSPTVQYVEAGRRFYVKIQDTDFPVLASMGYRAFVTATTLHGDKEQFECIPLASDGLIYIGSIPTDVGVPKVGDKILQVYGGDEITATYPDANTVDGKVNVPRQGKVKVVSTGGLSFVMGDGETRAVVAFQEQPLALVLLDTDLDVSDNADTAEIKLVSRYKKEEETEEEEADKIAKKGIDIEKLMEEGKVKYEVRDEITLKMTEVGGTPCHSGRFEGKTVVRKTSADKPVDKTDAILSAADNDEIVATYIDELSINGPVRREVSITIPVAGEIDNRPKIIQDMVLDAVIRSKKALVEGQAYLELARIFMSMGLAKGAQIKADEGLDRADSIIRTKIPIPVNFKHEAFKLKWELHMAADQLAQALATCNLFNQMYPDSPFVDQALMGIAKIRLENKEYKEAQAVFQQVLALEVSEAKPEAQFRLGELAELIAAKEAAKNPTAKKGATTIPESAVAAYKTCAERYPHSEYAGESLAKMVDYYIESKDNSQANTLLEQVFQDYPDAKFLDSMLLKWTVLAFRTGDYQKANDKCSQLLFEYPGSPFAEKAKQIMPKIEAQLQRGKTDGKSGEGKSAEAKGTDEKTN